MTSASSNINASTTKTHAYTQPLVDFRIVSKTRVFEGQSFQNFNEM